MAVLDSDLHAATRDLEHSLQYSVCSLWSDLIADVNLQEPCDLVLNSHSILRSRQEGAARVDQI